MAIDHFVPAGKVLRVPTGNYVFKGPVRAILSGAGIKLPSTYEDGTPTTGESEASESPSLSEILDEVEPPIQHPSISEDSNRLESVIDAKEEEVE